MLTWFTYLRQAESMCCSHAYAHSPPCVFIEVFYCIKWNAKLNVHIFLVVLEDQNYLCDFKCNMFFMLSLSMLYKTYCFGNKKNIYYSLFFKNKIIFFGGGGEKKTWYVKHTNARLPIVSKKLDTTNTNKIESLLSCVYNFLFSFFLRDIQIF